MSAFGKSHYGERFDFSNRKCQDPLCAAIYIIHIIGLIYSVFHVYLIDYDNMDVSNWHHPHDINSMNWTGVYVVIPVCITCGLLFGIIWWLFLRKCSRYVLQSMLLSNVVLWGLTFIVSLPTLQLPLLIVSIIVCAGYAIHYTLFAFYRISFGIDLIAVAIVICNDFFQSKPLRNRRILSAVILLTLLLDIGYLWMWASSFYGYVIIAVEHDNIQPEGWIVFLYIVSLVWGLSVNANLHHTIFCGAFSMWYYQPLASGNSQPLGDCSKVVLQAVTKQFGSICCGATLVPFVEAVRSVFNAFVFDSDTCIISCACLCCVNCVEYLFGYFNESGFAFMSVYGNCSFVSASHTMFQLFERRAMIEVLMDDITGVAFFSASLMCALCTSAIAYMLAFIFYGQDPDESISVDLVTELAVYGGIIGLVMCLGILRNFRSIIVAFWVCFAESPECLRENRPKLFRKIYCSHPKIASLNMQIANKDDEDETDIETDGGMLPTPA